MKLELLKDVSYHFGMGDIAVIPAGTKIIPVADGLFRVWTWDGMRPEERNWHRVAGFFAKPGEIRTIWTKAESLKLAAKLGREAFERGVAPVQSFDDNLTPLLSQWGNPLARQDPSRQRVLRKVLDAWLSAWHTASVSARLETMVKRTTERTQLKPL